MTGDPLQRLNGIGRAIVQLSTALEQLPLARVTPRALLSRAADPGALLDELLAPLVELGAPPAAEEYPGDLPAGESMLPAAALALNQTTGRTSAHLAGSVKRRSESRAVWPGGSAPSRPAAQGFDERAVARPDPHIWELSGQLNPPGPPRDPGESTAVGLEQTLFDTGPRLPLAGVHGPIAATDSNVPARPFEPPIAQLGVGPARSHDSSGAVSPSRSDPGGDEPDQSGQAPSAAIANGSGAMSGGLRLVRDGATLSTLLRAHTRMIDGMAVPGSNLAQPIHRGGHPSSYSNDPGDVTLAGRAAAPARQETLQDASAVEAAAQPAVAQREALDIEEIMRELAERLEFEYLRMYGTSGD